MLSSGLADAALIMAKGRFFFFFLIMLKSWVSRVGGLGSASSALFKLGKVGTDAIKVWEDDPQLVSFTGSD